ncbi:type II toxin-antitoxin system RelE/ParE family toxin [Zavarzinia compransoris]|uniref:Plasmid stabilization protein n=1 Tax=Zavarzinia compransoris TaxID=1264899 RepID=A0A317E7Q8_9PROT|nr:type II toxin-antitoxin system RelE/ParE family toxin [Zavarzinia compransoris]PWR22286.1 plasmid stabilization protein [Zavarzinia compransoris]TDP46951.1 plasmid stabilization system protein ParE [Zavarzinia compransoris]
MTYEVRWAPAAVQKIGRYIRTARNRAGAARFMDGLRLYCDGFAASPHRGATHDDIRPGLRSVGYRRRATILFVIDEGRKRVVILGVFTGGQDTAPAMRRNAKPPLEE